LIIAAGAAELQGALGQYKDLYTVLLYQQTSWFLEIWIFWTRDPFSGGILHPRAKFDPDTSARGELFAWQIEMSMMILLTKLQ